nr:hypothetical protein TEA_025091 [Ipomoea batatas]GMD48360.1 hypothetical protein TEA_025091 [Ipomoea batatas]
MINTNIINSYPFLDSGGGLSSVGELLGLKEKALAALLNKVVLALVLPDLHHVVFPPPPRLVRIHPSFVRLLPGIRPGAWPQRHFFPNPARFRDEEVEKANKRQRIENAEAEMRITERLRNPVSIRVDDSERQMVQHVTPQDLALKHDSEHKLGMILMDVLKKLDISLLNGKKPGGECII